VARRVEEIVLIHIPTLWSYGYRGDGSIPLCRHTGCISRKTKWCVRFYYHYGGGYVSQYWCDEHLPKHHHARRAFAQLQGRYRHPFAIPLSSKEALAEYKRRT